MDKFLSDAGFTDRYIKVVVEEYRREDGSIPSIAASGLLDSGWSFSLSGLSIDESIEASRLLSQIVHDNGLYFTAEIPTFGPIVEKYFPLDKLPDIGIHLDEGVQFKLEEAGIRTINDLLQYDSSRLAAATIINTQEMSRLPDTLKRCGYHWQMYPPEIENISDGKARKVARTEYQRMLVRIRESAHAGDQPNITEEKKLFHLTMIEYHKQELKKLA